jgi:hypothetical protein
LHCRCHKMMLLVGRGKSAAAQGVARLQDEGEGCATRKFEEFRVSDKSEHCCQIPQRREGNRFLREQFGRRVMYREGDYVPLAFHWRWGSRMMRPHSTQRTLRALCSSSETQSEMRRLCAQARGGLIESGCAVRPDSSTFIVHLSNDKRIRYRISIIVNLRYVQYKTPNIWERRRSRC